VGIEPGTLSLRGNDANHHTTVQPRSWMKFAKISLLCRRLG